MSLKIIACIKPCVTCILLVATTSVFSSNAYAETSKSQPSKENLTDKPVIAPISIEADRAQIDEKKGISTYSGHVVLVQGSIEINAEEISVHSVNGKLDKITALGTPVTYSQQQPNGENISGEAYSIDYFASQKRIVFLDHAKLKQGRSEFSGNRIEYDTVKDVVTASVSKTGQQRVRVTIQPDDKKMPDSTPVADLDPEPKPEPEDNKTLQAAPKKEPKK